MAASAAPRATGKALNRIVATLRRLEADETLLVQSGKPVGVFRTHADAPRVLIANSNLVPRWATWEHFHELDRRGLMMYGQMTAGSWIYIGSQGIVQGTYETFVEMGRRHFGGDMLGRWILTAGLGGMGGAQPLAATMAGASMLAVECQPSRIEMRLKTGYLDMQAPDLDAALAIMQRSCAERKPVSVGLLGNAAEIFPELVRRGVRPDAVTDQTSAHDPVNGYLPRGWTGWGVGKPARGGAGRSRHGGQAINGRTCSRDAGIPPYGYSNRGITGTISARWRKRQASPTPSISRASCRLTYVRCSAAASARFAGPRYREIPKTFYRTDEKVRELLPDNAALHNWLAMARQKIKFQGLPARICWVGLGDRHRLGLAFNEMVARGELRAPIVIGRDHLDSGSVARTACGPPVKQSFSTVMPAFSNAPSLIATCATIGVMPPQIKPTLIVGMSALRPGVADAMTAMHERAARKRSGVFSGRPFH